MFKLRLYALAALVGLALSSQVHAQGSNIVVPLLVNASQSGNLFANVQGGNYNLNLAGTVGGSSVTVTVADSAGNQQTVATFTAVGNQCIAIPARSNVQANVTGGSPVGLYLNASGVQYCPAGTGGSSSSQNVNIAQINGAAPSLTNPIYTAYAEAGDTTGTFTNATQSTAITATNADGYATALVSINGTYGTATATFQASDDGGVTFYTMSCVRSDGTAVETGYTTLTNTNRQWFCPVSGNDSFRVQSSAVASGTVNVRISISAPPTNSAVVSGPTGTGANQVQGTSASGATDDGSNPVKVGGIFLSTAPTILTGQRGNLQIGPRGGLGISVLDNTLGAFQDVRTYAGIPTAGTGVLPAGLVSIFSATPSVLTDGQYGSVNMTARHALQVAHVATDGVITAASGNVANANAVATLAAGGASKTTYITGFQCTASGSTIGLAVNLTVAGVVTGTMTYTFVFTAGVLTEAPILNVSYPNPIPASALNTAITVTLPAGGTGNTNAACNAQGYQL